MSEINANSTNKPTNMPNVAGSGLSSVESIANGGIQLEQKTRGDGFRQETVKASVKGNGKSFTIGR